MADSIRATGCHSGPDVDRYRDILGIAAFIECIFYITPRFRFILEGKDISNYNGAAGGIRQHFINIVSPATCCTTVYPRDGRTRPAYHTGIEVQCWVIGES